VDPEPAEGFGRWNGCTTQSVGETVLDAISILEVVGGVLDIVSTPEAAISISEVAGERVPGTISTLELVGEAVLDAISTLKVVEVVGGAISSSNVVGEAVSQVMSTSDGVGEGDRNAVSTLEMAGENPPKRASLSSFTASFVSYRTLFSRGMAFERRPRLG
jgi:hypothetical protein